MIKKIALNKQDMEEFGYLRLNLKELQDDHYDYSKVVVKKPWGYEYLLFSNKFVAVWILHLKKSAQTSMHCHPGKKTSLVVLEGMVICSTLIEKVSRSAGEGLLIDKGVFHQTETASESAAFIMEIETPVNKRDLVRLKDKYGREGKGYETEDQHSFNTQNYNHISFQEKEIQHNLKKRFGHCSITFKRLTDKKNLDEVLGFDSEDIICILDGELLNSSGQSVLDVGDTITIKALKLLAPARMGRDVEMLIIKKIDHVIKVSDYVAVFLNEQNIKPVFIVPGDANVHLLDSIGRYEGLSFICTQNEKSASLAVESFCKLRSSLGVLVVSSGAAAANTIPGVANAWIDSIPMLVISGQARTDQDSDSRVRQLGNKTLDVVTLVKSITKYAVKVTEPKMIRYHLEKGIYLATHGKPGPVWINLPIDIQGMSIGLEDLVPFELNKSAAKTSNNEISHQIVEIIELLKRASRPVILAGSGIRHAKAASDFLELIDQLQVPVLTSRRGADLVPDAHPCFFGRPSAYGQRSANFIIQNCDLLISIGSRLSIPLIGRNTKAFARAAYKVVVDIDPNELKKPTVKPDLPLALDAGQFIREFLMHLPASLPLYSAWEKRCREWRQTFPSDSYGGPSLPHSLYQKELIYPFSVLRALSAELDEGDVIVSDGGLATMYTLLAFRFKRGQRLISSTGLELPGFALAGAIGACIARDRKPVICLCEDRGFQMSIQDLQTIIDYRLPIKVLILKSRGHSNIRNIQRDYFGGRFIGTDNEICLGAAPLLQLARSFGFVTFEINHTLELPLILREWSKMAGPAICEILVEDDQDIISRPGFTIREEEKWIAKPLEDMYPFLERQILQENMLIDLLQED